MAVRRSAQRIPALRLNGRELRLETGTRFPFCFRGLNGYHFSHLIESTSIRESQRVDALDTLRRHAPTSAFRADNHPAGPGYAMARRQPVN